MFISSIKKNAVFNGIWGIFRAAAAFRRTSQSQVSKVLGILSNNQLLNQQHQTKSVVYIVPPILRDRLSE